MPIFSEIKYRWPVRLGNNNSVYTYDAYHSRSMLARLVVLTPFNVARLPQFFSRIKLTFELQHV